MERPALKQLLADIDARKIDTVVVYKVDRLTRSLADFAKIIEIFDARRVSFVSVTQQFNTTSSMGRLTLNVLLSFAQFEREVTGERIRDKIAASKRKGMFMGGRVPFGYDLRDRKLIINKKEAEQVEQIFSHYIELGCVRKLKQHLEKKGIKSKTRIGLSGKKTGGTPYSRGALYRILSNRTYLGEVFHKGNVYPGEHAPIIDRAIWDQVQANLAKNAHARRHGTSAIEPSILRGLVYDPQGNRFTPTHAVKNGKRYRYYTSQKIIQHRTMACGQPARIPARDLERLVLTELRDFFATTEKTSDALITNEVDLATARALIQASHQYAREIDTGEPSEIHEKLSGIVSAIVIDEELIYIHVSKSGTRARLLQDGSAASQVSKLTSEHEEKPIVLAVPAKVKRCGMETRLIIPVAADNLNKKPAPALVKAVSRAYEWVYRLETGEFENVRAIARATGLAPRHVRLILRSAFLSPNMVEAIIEGSQPLELTLASLLKEIPLSWAAQHSKVGLSGPTHRQKEKIADRRSS
jgi:site-specific DNA recombinase